MSQVTGHSPFPLEERRGHIRSGCLIPIDYVVEGHHHVDFARNLSARGAFIAASKRFSIGQKLDLVFQLAQSQKPVKLIGRIARVSPKGFGVEFESTRSRFMEGDGQETGDRFRDAKKGSADPKVRSGEKGNLRKKKLRWEPSPSAGISGYRLYWSRTGEVHYDSEKADLGKVQEIVLPDDVPAFPLVAGEMTLGVSAINEAGNESSITMISTHLDFTVPEAPTHLEIEDLQRRRSVPTVFPI